MSVVNVCFIGKIKNFSVLRLIFLDLTKYIIPALC
jgi:hypothetical protein